MSQFSTKLTTSAVEIVDSNKVQKEQLLSEISKYSEDLQILKDSFKEYKFSKKELEEINSSIEMKSEELSKIESRIEEINKLISQADNIKDNIQTLKDTEIKFKDSISKLQSSINSLNEEKGNIVSATMAELGELNSKIDILNKDIYAKDGISTKLDKEITEKSTKLDEITENLKDVTMLVASKEDELLKIQENIDSIEINEKFSIDKLNKIKGETTDAEDKLFDLNKSIENKKLELEKLDSENELKFAEREGNISLQNQSLDDKRAVLMTIKQILEKEKGQIINITI